MDNVKIFQQTTIRINKWVNILKIIDVVKKFLFDEEGATAVEYAIMASAIAAVIVAVVLAVGTKVNSLFGAAKDAMTSNGI